MPKDDKNRLNYYWPTRTPISYNQQLDDPTWQGQYVPGTNRISLSTEGAWNPDNLKHEIMHAILRQDPRFYSENAPIGGDVANDFMTKLDNIVKQYRGVNDPSEDALLKQLKAALGKDFGIVQMPQIVRELPKYTEALPASIFGGYSVQNWPTALKQQLRSQVLGFTNQNLTPESAYNLNQLAQLNKFYPDLTKSPGAIPIQPQPAPSLLQHFLAVIGNQQGPSPWGS